MRQRARYRHAAVPAWRVVAGYRFAALADQWPRMRPVLLALVFTPKRPTLVE